QQAPPARGEGDAPATVQRDEGEERMGFLLDLRRRGIVDQRVLRAMDQVPRENFVTPDYAEEAYADQALPIACGQTISQPYVVTAAAEEIPDPLVVQLGEGGVMVLPLGPHGGAQRIVKLTKSADGTEREDLIWVRFVPLLPGQAREL